MIRYVVTLMCADGLAPVDVRTYADTEWPKFGSCMQVEYITKYYPIFNHCHFKRPVINSSWLKSSFQHNDTRGSLSVGWCQLYLSRFHTGCNLCYLSARGRNSWSGHSDDVIYEVTTVGFPYPWRHNHVIYVNLPQLFSSGESTAWFEEKYNEEKSKKSKISWNVSINHHTNIIMCKRS